MNMTRKMVLTLVLSTAYVGVPVAMPPVEPAKDEKKVEQPVPAAVEKQEAIVAKEEVKVPTTPVTTEPAKEEEDKASAIESTATKAEDKKMLEDLENIIKELDKELPKEPAKAEEPAK